MHESVDVLVIGGGPAGLAAALAARAEGAGPVLVIEREAALGGILRQCIHTGFGLHRFQSELTGPEYARRDIERLAAAGVAWRCDTTVLSLSPGRLAETISTRDGVQLIEAGSVVLAMGCRERPCGALAIPGEHGAGILSAGTAQRLVNLEGLMPGRRVVILGSGDIGLIMARRLTCEGAEVLACVEIMPYSSGLRRNIVQCLDDFGIPLLLSHTVVGIEGRERLSAVTIAQVDDCRCPVPGTERRLECDTLLLSVGLIPEIELARQAGIALAPSTGGPEVDQSLATSAPGVFACGNVLHVHDLVDDVSAEGERAGREAARFVRAGAASRPSPPASALREWRLCAGAGAGGVVPQILRLAPGSRLQEPVRASFRPTGVFSPARVAVLAGERTLLQKRHRILTPGEQTGITLGVDLLARLADDPHAEALCIEAACLAQADEKPSTVEKPSAAGAPAPAEATGDSCRVTCVQCPMGCPITVVFGEDGTPAASGQHCARGADYARSEVADPRRMLTTLVVVPERARPLPVRTARPIPKKLFACALATIHQTTPVPPIEPGAVVVADLEGTGIAVIASDELP